MEKILIIEKDDKLSEEMKGTFISNNYKVFTTDKSARALNMLENDNIAVIIMGHNEDDQNKNKLLEHAKKKFKRVKIIYTSELMDEKTLSEIKDYIDSALLKPFPLDKMLDTVNKLLTKRQKENSLNKMDKKVFQAS